MHDSGADGPRQHGRTHPVLVVGVAEQHSVETGEELLERLVVGEQPDDHRVELQGGGRPASFDGHVDDAGEQHFAGPWPGLLGLSGLQRIVEPAELPLGQRDDDLFLGLELVIDGRLGDADRVGDHLQRRAADAVVGDQREGRVQDAVLRRAAVHGREPAGCDAFCGDHITRVAAWITRCHGHVISAHTIAMSTAATST